MGRSILIVSILIYRERIERSDRILIVRNNRFCSDVNRNTSEVLLEVYDRANKSQRFLGLGIVGIDELLANPSQRQIIPLQNRPYEEEDITGTLTVEVSNI